MKIIKVLGLLILTIIGGLIAQQLVWPFLLQYPFFAQYEKTDQPIQVTEQNNIYIEENTALEEAVEKVTKSVVGVQTVTTEGNLEGSGLIITSDGLMITLAELVPLGGDFSFYLNGELASYQILKRDLDNNLALIKLGENNLKTLSFAEQDKIKLGEEVFLFGYLFGEKGTQSQIVNEGTIRKMTDNLIETNIFEEKGLLGSPLIDVKGNFLGLNQINEEGRVVTIPINTIKKFTGF
jgi:S1-C subfamily serine protease